MPMLQANGIDLNYEIIGQGPPLLFIHGLGSSGQDWEQQVAFFSKNYNVIIVDVRGHGASAKPPGPYSIQLFADDISSFIRTMDISPVHVVGISMGGMIAFQLFYQICCTLLCEEP